MPKHTERLDLYKVDPETDGNDTFNIDTMLNDNWDKIDQNVAMVDENGEVINKDGSSAGGVQSVNGKKGAVELGNEDVGLSNVDNVKQASKTEFDSHRRNEAIHATQEEKDSWSGKYDKPVDGIPMEDLSKNVSDKIESSAKESDLNSHINDNSNPHKTNKSDIGLGSVQNYGIATSIQASTGVGNETYMTPFRTKQAIENLAPEGISEEDVDDKITTHAEKTNVHGLDSATPAIGLNASVNGGFTTALGRNSSAGDNSATAIGNRANAAGRDSTAIGTSANAADINATALGRNASADNDATAIGHDSNAGTYATALGRKASAEGNSATAIGYDASAERSFATAIGTGANAVAYATALGRNASADNNATTIGYGASAGTRGTALGSGASSAGSHTVAIGLNATSNNSREGVLGSGNANYTNKWIVPGQFTVEGTKNFEMPHPHPDKQETHRLRHSAVESPTAGDNLYRFEIEATEALQEVEYELPDYFMYLNKDIDVWVNGVDHFGNAYGKVEGNTLKVNCEYAGKYNVLVIGTRNDEHQSIKDWNIKGVEREIGESWTGETYVFTDKEIISDPEIIRN